MMTFNKINMFSIAAFLTFVLIFPLFSADGISDASVKANLEYGETDPYPLLLTDTRDIMWISATKIGMDLGYDSTIEIYCFFKSNLVNQKSDEIKRDRKSSVNEFDLYMDTIDPDTVWTIYTQMNGNIAGAQFLQRHYKRNKIWKYVNYINKTVMPGCMSYFKSLDDYVKKNPILSAKLKNSSTEIIECRKRAILSQKNRLRIVDEYQ